MAVVVAHAAELVIGELRREAPGIDRGTFAAPEDHRAERSVLVMRGDSVVGCDDFGDVLVAVVSVEVGGW